MSDMIQLPHDQAIFQRVHRALVRHCGHDGLSAAIHDALTMRASVSVLPGEIDRMNYALAISGEPIQFEVK